MSVRARHSNTLLERREVETEDVADLGSGKGRIVVQAAPRYRYLDPEEHKRLVAAGPGARVPPPGRALRRLARIDGGEIRHGAEGVVEGDHHGPRPGRTRRPGDRSPL